MTTCCDALFGRKPNVCGAGNKAGFRQTTDAADTLETNTRSAAEARTEQPLIVAFEQFLWEDLIAHFLRWRRVLDYKAHQSLVRTHQMP